MKNTFIAIILTVCSLPTFAQAMSLEQCFFDPTSTPVLVDDDIPMDEIKEYLMCSALRFFKKDQSGLFFQFDSNATSDQSIDKVLQGRWSKTVVVSYTPKMEAPLFYTDMQYGDPKDSVEIIIEQCDTTRCKFYIKVTPFKVKKNEKYTRVVEMYKDKGQISSFDPSKSKLQDSNDEQYVCKYLEFVNEVPTLACYIALNPKVTPESYQIVFFEKNLSVTED